MIKMCKTHIYIYSETQLPTNSATHQFVASLCMLATNQLVANNNKCYSFCIYTIGTINFLGRQLLQPYWMYPAYQLHNWYYHFLRNELQYIFGIITKVALYFLTADKKETMMKMCNKLGLSCVKLSLA